MAHFTGKQFMTLLRLFPSGYIEKDARRFLEGVVAVASFAPCSTDLTRFVPMHPAEQRCSSSFFLSQLSLINRAGYLQRHRPNVPVPK